MKKLLCFILLGLLLAAQGCQAVVNTEDSLDTSKTESNTISSDNKESKDASEETSIVDASADDNSAEQTVDTNSSEEKVQYEYAIDITPYLESIYSEDLLLVNKQNSIDKNYVPSNLVSVTYTRPDRAKGKMVATAEKALCAFLEEAYHYGYTDVTVTSAYRDYNTQEWYFNYYIENEMKSGKTREQATAAVLTYSARPGTSEHQTGLCVDMHNLASANQSFGNTKAGQWMAANAHRFGFILRFPKGKEDITGYSYEPWHFRFVGIEHASVIYNEGLCLEEYLAEAEVE